MYNFCTLFDSNYLHKGLALYQSLCRTCDGFRLFVVAFDEECFKILQNLNLQHLIVISLSEIETEELLNVKPLRNRAEYCWTSGPSVIYYCIQNYNLDHCTYLDSDLMFFNSPKPIFDEIAENSIAISEHFSNNIDELGGRFCVQFVYFKNDENGIKALLWWKNSCIDWCYARYEDGKYGDQKYLDFFPKYFKSVHIIQHRGAGVAPWNVNSYSLSEYGKIGYNNRFYDLIFFHFHGTRIEINDGSLDFKAITYDIDNDAKKNIFSPYLDLLKFVFEQHLRVNINSIKLSNRNVVQRTYSILKKSFRNYSFVQYFYFKVFRIRYNGYENK